MRRMDAEMSLSSRSSMMIASSVLTHVDAGVCRSAESRRDRSERTSGSVPLLVTSILGILLMILAVISLRPAYDFPILSLCPWVHARFAPRKLAAVLATWLLWTRRSGGSLARPDVASLPLGAIIERRRISLVRISLVLSARGFFRRDVTRASGPVLSVFGDSFDWPFLGRWFLQGLVLARSWRPLRVGPNTPISAGIRRVLQLRFARVGSDRFAICRARLRHRVQGAEQGSRLGFLLVAFPASLRRGVQEKIAQLFGYAPHFSRVGYFLAEIREVRGTIGLLSRE